MKLDVPIIMAITIKLKKLLVSILEIYFPR